MERRGAGPGDGDAAQALAQRLLQQLVQYVNLKPNVKDFDVIPVEVNHSNKSPVIYADEHLGVESWCVKYVYDYAYNALMDERLVDGAKRKPKKITRNNCDRVDSLLMAALLFNPDVTTFWNRRREMVLKNFLAASNELRFARLVLSYKPKSNEAFAYRKWLLNRNFNDTNGNFVYIMRDIIEEFAVTIACAEKCPNNYHAWSHRIWLMKLLNEHPRFRAHCSMRGKYVSEYFRTEQWVSAHVSDYSGMHYRQFCLGGVLRMPNFFEHVDHGRFELRGALRQLLAENSESDCAMLDDDHDDEAIMGSKCTRAVYECACLLAYELKFNEQLARTYASHETLWCHRKFVVHKMVALIFDHFGEARPKASVHGMPGGGNVTAQLEVANDRADNGETASFGKEPKMSRYDNYSTYNSALYKALAANERKFVDQRHKAGDTCCQKYELWLRLILKFSF